MVYILTLKHGTIMPKLVLHGSDHMVVGYATTYALSAYHH